jgi:hypothetical protein
MGIFRKKAHSGEVSVEKAQAPKPKMKAKGVPGLRFSSGYIEEEFIRDLRWPRAGKIYQEMSSNDPVVGGCIYLIETMIRKVEWKVDENGAGQEAADFLKSCMDDMQEQSWDDFISEVLSELIYGFSLHEIVYKIRRGPMERDLKFRSKYTDGKIGWMELPRVAQSSLYEWEFNDQGHPETFIQDTQGLAGGDKGYIEIPIYGNLLFRTKSDKNNPEGFSLLRRAYRPWYFKKNLEEIEGIGVERALAGIPVMQPKEGVPLFDPDNEEMVELLDWAMDVVTGLRQDKTHGLVIPEGWDLHLLKGENASNIKVNEIIQRYDTRIAISMLADLILLGNDRTGSFAMAETKQDMFLYSLETIVKSICNTLNTQAVPKLFAVNGMPMENLPLITADRIKDATVSELSMLLRSLNIDVTKSEDLFRFLMRSVGGPQINNVADLKPDEATNVPGTKTSGTFDSQLEDPIDNQFK